MRELRIAAHVQLPLDLQATPASSAQRWWLLSDAGREQVVILLARLIAKGVVAEEVDADA